MTKSHQKAPLFQPFLLKLVKMCPENWCFCNFAFSTITNCNLKQNAMFWNHPYRRKHNLSNENCTFNNSFYVGLRRIQGVLVAPYWYMGYGIWGIKQWRNHTKQQNHFHTMYIFFAQVSNRSKTMLGGDAKCLLSLVEKCQHHVLE